MPCLDDNERRKRIDTCSVRVAFVQQAMGAAAGVSDVWPVSAQGATRLSFSLCNAAAAPGYHFTWDFDAVRRRYVDPIAAALAPVTSVTVDSQVIKAAFPVQWRGQLDPRTHKAMLALGVGRVWPGRKPMAAFWPENRFRGCGSSKPRVIGTTVPLRGYPLPLVSRSHLTSTHPVSSTGLNPCVLTP